jgi:membrane associated rhomboid family serine protease
MLTGWGLKGLFGHMWLHAGFFHLFGNMLFLWLFGNAVCAKIGNLRYLLLYVLLGMTAGAAHVMFSGGNALGASGAVNGIVGMYLVLFYENEITCLFAFWLIFPYVRTFSVSSMWIILLWLLWDVLGAIGGGAHVAYFAHLGGFASGFGIAFFMCYKGWITMERYEESLLQAWRRWRHPEQTDTLAAAYATLGLPAPTIEERPAPEVPDPKPIPLPQVKPSSTRRAPATNGAIRTVCACGRDVTVPPQYAGKTIRCSTCGHPVVIPQQSNFFGPPAEDASTPAKRTPSIRFTCTCGKKIKAPASYAGRIGKCPQCGSRVKIPPVSA